MKLFDVFSMHTYQKYQYYGSINKNKQQMFLIHKYNDQISHSFSNLRGLRPISFSSFLYYPKSMARWVLFFVAGFSLLSNS